MWEERKGSLVCWEPAVLESGEGRGGGRVWELCTPPAPQEYHTWAKSHSMHRIEIPSPPHLVDWAAQKRFLPTSLWALRQVLVWPVDPPPRQRWAATILLRCLARGQASWHCWQEREEASMVGNIWNETLRNHGNWYTQPTVRTEPY